MKTRTLRRTLSTGFGLGRFPLAPGTAMSAACFAFYGALVVFSGLFDQVVAIRPLGFVILAAAGIVVFSLATILDGRSAIRDFGSRDPRQIVGDEAAGAFLALIGTTLYIPPEFALPVAFVFFRFLDIAKPLGIRRLEKLPAGWGMLADDLAAGLLANGLTWLTAWIAALAGAPWAWR